MTYPKRRLMQGRRRRPTLPAAAETEVAATAEMPPSQPDQAIVTAADHAMVEDSTRIAETKIATLGGPPVTIEGRTARGQKLAPAAVKKPRRPGA